MPTAEVYDDFKSQLESAGEAMMTMARAIPNPVSARVIRSPQVGPLVGRAVEAILLNVAASAQQLELLAAECGRRAQVCRNYTMLYNSYGVALWRWSEIKQQVGALAAGPPPAEPDQPAPWAERG